MNIAPERSEVCRKCLHERSKFVNETIFAKVLEDGKIFLWDGMKFAFYLKIGIFENGFISIRKDGPPPRIQIQDEHM